jgi:hypothetical protein
MADEAPPRPNVLRVHFADGSHKTFPSKDPNITAAGLKTIVANKLGVVGTQCFAIWAKSDLLELKFENDDKVMEIVNTWNALETKYKGKATKIVDGVECPRIFFRRERLVPKRIEKAATDPASIHLLYLEAVGEVVNSIELVSAEDALTLAGMEMQASFGNHEASMHKKGFLTSRVSAFIPAHLLADKAHKKRDWEVEIYEKHKELAGQDATKVELDYLTFVRKFPAYGCTYVEVETKKTTKPFHKVPKHVRLGVNVDGVHLQDPAAHSAVDFFLLKELTAAIPDDNSLTLNIKRETDAEYVFSTLQGKLINNIIQAAVQLHLPETAGGAPDAGAAPVLAGSGGSVVITPKETSLGPDAVLEDKTAQYQAMSGAILQDLDDGW